MKLRHYRTIYEQLYNHSLVGLSEMFPDVSYNTLVSMHAQRYQAEMRRNQPILKRRKEEFYKRYKEKENIVDMAQDVSLAPCLMAQLIIEVQFGKRHPEYLKDPSLLQDSDSRLCEEISQCNSVDIVYSPFVEKIKHATGLEYEYILEEKLRNIGVPFVTEGELRGRGYSHTPDCKLEIPVKIDGMEVNWIDSKASFGDEYYLSMNSKEQFSKYVLRYGPGLVIYWFGFVDELAEMKGSGVLVLDDFPTDDRVTMLGTNVTD